MKYSPAIDTTWLILFITTIAPHLAAGVPTRRDNPVDGKTVDSLLFQAFDDFFKSQGLGGFNSSIYRQEHPWRLVDFLQDGGNHTMSPLAANATVYDLAESFPSDDQDKTTFAEEYITFVMDAGKALGLDDVNPPPNVASAANQSEELCSEALNVASEARLYYGKLAGKPVIGNDPDFQDWLFTENTTYIVAKQKCNPANMKYQNALTGEYSAEVRRLMPTFQRINKLNNAGSAIPGITMQVAGDPNEKVVSSDDGANVAPLVSMPGLDQSIEGWSKGEEPGFEWDSNQADSSQDASSISLSAGGSAELGPFGSGSFSFSFTDSKSSASYHASHLALSFAGIGFIPIERGLWFDDFNLAKTIHKNENGATTNATGVFNKYMGTKEHPGPAAVY